MAFHLGFFILGAVILVGATLIFLSEAKKRKTNTEKINAEVVGYYTQVEHSSDPDVGGDTITQHPFMKYCVHGQWYEQCSETGWNKQKYAVGTRVDILYDPKHPEHFMFLGENTALIASLIGLAAGAVLIILAFTL